MDPLDDVGPGEAEEVVVALEVVRMAAKPLAAEIGLGQLAGLDHRALGPVQNDDALLEQAAQFGGGGRVRLMRGGHGLNMYRHIKI